VDYRKNSVMVNANIHHNGGYWNGNIWVIMMFNSLTAGWILLRTGGEIWVCICDCLLTLRK